MSSLRRISVLFALAACPITEVRAGGGNSADQGMWLVNLARHQGHLIGRGDPRSASLHVMALLEGATLVSPDCAEAYYWLYDLNQRMGRSQPARAALSRYVRLMPGDDGARLKRLEIELAERHTSEARAQFVQEELQQKPMSRLYESALRSWLAMYHQERDEKEAAGKEVETALRLNPMNIQAREVAYELYGDTQPELQRVEMALQMIAVNPSQVNLVWDLAEFLDRVTLHKQAQEWYNRAIELHRRAEAGPIPADLWQKLALSYLCAEDHARAKDAADEALKADPSFHSARLLRANLLRKLGDEKAAQADEDFVRQAYRARADEVFSKNLTEEASQVAWYFCYHNPDKDQAMKLAEVAMKDRSPSPLAKLAYGYALSANGRTDDAIKILEPLASADQLAGLELARCMIQRGRQQEAIKVLKSAAAIQPSGIAFVLIRDLLDKYGEKLTPREQPEKVIAALDRFQRDVFDYYRRTADFLKFTIRFDTADLPPTGPVNVVLRLENKAPFIITFGEGFMARPLVAISARLGGESGTEFRDYLQVLLSERPALVPGDAVEKTVAIDVGPMRERLLTTLTKDTPIEVTALFDPVYQQGKLAPGLGSVSAGPISITRKAADMSSAAMTALSDQASTGDVTARVHAADMAGALLASAGASETPATPQLRSILAKLVADREEMVRAHALVAAGWSPLADDFTRAAAGAVRDERPVVRMLAVRLFAMQQGEAFKSVLQHLSQSDPETAVRTMAACFLPDGAGMRSADDDLTTPAERK